MHPHSDLRAQLQTTGVFDLDAQLPGISVRRRLALAIGALLTSVCLLVYLGLIPLIAWAIQHFISEHGLLPWIPSSFPLLIVFWALSFSGCLLILSLLKPLVARPGRVAVPKRLDPDCQPLLFAFVRELAVRGGMPEPAKIAVDWSVNCCCVFAGGLSAVFRPELELVIGLPLVVGLRLDQLAGALAHELTHAAQTTASQSSRLIWSVNAWFLRVALERDAFDERVLQWLETARRTKRLLLYCVQWLFAPGRAVARLMMLVEAAASSVFLRGMEREADRCQVRMAGTEGFISTLREINLLSVAAQRAVVELSQMWRERCLVDNYPRLVSSIRSRYSEAFVDHLQAGIEAGKTGILSIHPCDSARMALARTQAAPGALNAGLPATALFADFDALCRQVTIEYYDQDLGLGSVTGDLVPLQNVLNRQQHGPSNL